MPLSVGLSVRRSVCWSVRLLDISRDCSLFVFFAWSLSTVRVEKWQSPIFLKKSWGSQMGEKPFWGHFWCFCPYLCIQSFKVFWNFTYITSSTLSNSEGKPHVQEKSRSGCIVMARPYFWDMVVVSAFLVFVKSCE